MRARKSRTVLAVVVCMGLLVLTVPVSPAAGVGETTWLSMAETLPGFPNCVEQVTAEEVFVGTTAGISRSLNGGETWQQVCESSSAEGYFDVRDITFGRTAKWQGYAVGQWHNLSATQYQSLILYTHDGGLTWERQDDEAGTSEPPLNGVDAADTSHALYVGDGGVFGYTLTGGSSWSSWGLGGNPDLNDCSANWHSGDNKLYGVLVGDGGLISSMSFTVGDPSPVLFSETSGVTDDLYGICENHSYNYSSAVVGDGAFHLEGENNGTSWTDYTTIASAAPGVFDSYRDIDDYDTDEWYACGQRHVTIPTSDYRPHIAHTDNAGDTWDYVSIPDTDDELTSISCLPAENIIREGWACSSSTLLHMASTSAERISGSDRYETAERICAETLPSGLSRSAVLATGQGFADALSAAGLCGVYGAPLLLVRDDLDPVVSELDRLNVNDVYIVGGTSAVPASIDATLTGWGISVTRFAGDDRYETAALVAEDVIANGSDFHNEFFVARGDSFPDALAVAPYACSQQIPILLTKPTSLPSSTESVLDAMAQDVWIMGGTAAVSTPVQGEIDVLLADNSGNPSERIQGANRYETAYNAAESGVSLGWAGDGCYIGVATGENYPDALAGGVATGIMHGSILLTKPSSLHTLTRQFIEDHGCEDTDLRVFGGTAAVRDVVLSEMATLF